MKEDFLMLFKKHEKFVYRTAFRVLKNKEDAEDAVQQTFVNASMGYLNFRGDSKFSTWICRVAQNVALEILRRGKKHLGDSRDERDVSEWIDLPDTTNKSADSQLVSKGSYVRLMGALDHLSPKMREVIVYHHLKEYSLAQTATILGIPEGTVKSRHHYGLLELRRIMSNGHVRDLGRED